MKCKCVVKNNSFEILVVFSPIFVADIKITFVYNFVAPLTSKNGMSKRRLDAALKSIASKLLPKGFTNFMDSWKSLIS